ncbi:MAG: hypothetical protein Q9227_006179 [Pyrenula ochraceoflavens]
MAPTNVCLQLQHYNTTAIEELRGASLDIVAGSCVPTTDSPLTDAFWAVSSFFIMIFFIVVVSLFVGAGIASLIEAMGYTFVKKEVAANDRRGNHQPVAQSASEQGDARREDS